MLKKNHKLIFVIITIAIIFRLIAIFKYGDFWDDEMFNFIYSQKQWPEGLKWWLWETNPPLHLLILKLWYFLVPATEFWSRLPSLFFGVVSVWVIYIFGEKAFNRHIGLISAGLLAIHPYHIFWSSTARIYSALMLLALLSTYFFWQIFIQNNQQNKLFIYFSLINLFLIFSHLTAGFIFFGQLLYVFITQKFAGLKLWLKINQPMIYLGLFWITLSFYLKRNNDLEQSWFLNIQQNWQNAVGFLNNLVVGLLPFSFGVIITLLSTILVLRFFIKATKENNYNFLSIFIIALMPILLSLALNVWHIKFFLISLPLIILLLTVSLYTINYKQIIISILIIANISGYYILVFNQLPLNNWSQVENFYIENADDNTILIYNYQILEPQLKHYLPKIHQKSIALNLYNDLNEDEIIVQKNYLFKKISHQEMETWWQNNNLNNYNKIILLQNEYYFSNQIDNFILEKNWFAIQKPIPAHIQGWYNLYVFTNNSND